MHVHQHRGPCTAGALRYTRDCFGRIANDARLYEALRTNTVLVSLEVRSCCLGLDSSSFSAVENLWEAL